MNIEDVAWAAGFFDGEGCIRVKYHKGYLELRLAVGQLSILPLEKLKILFGGYITKIRRPNKSDNHQWVVSHRKARLALMAMLPYLTVKRNMAGSALQCSDQSSLSLFREMWQSKHLAVTPL